MVVFYLGYCYNRHFEIYLASSEARSTIVSVCSEARACLPETAQRKLFVHLNLMHASAFCGVWPRLVTHALTRLAEVAHALYSLHSCEATTIGSTLPLRTSRARESSYQDHVSPRPTEATLPLCAHARSQH